VRKALILGDLADIFRQDDGEFVLADRDYPSGSGQRDGGMSPVTWRENGCHLFLSDENHAVSHA
jgi:hypothetical protein